MLQIEQTFMDFLLEHQERHNRTYHFLILMNSIMNAIKRILYYYLTGALRENLGLAGSVNVQGEEVMKMDEIANELVKHYLQRSGRVIHAVGDEEEEIIPMNVGGGRYFVYYDPMDGSSNVPHNLPHRVSLRRGQAQPGRPRRHASAGRPRVHCLRHVRHPHGNIHHCPPAGRVLAVPHRRDIQLCQAHQDGAPRQQEVMGTNQPRAFYGPDKKFCPALLLAAPHISNPIPRENSSWQSTHRLRAKFF